MELNKIYNQDNVQGIKEHIDDSSIDLTVTSPPYDDLREYGGHDWDFKPLAKKLYQVTKRGGVVVWVVKDQVEDSTETGTSFKQALFFKEKVGFNLHDTMIYKRKEFPFPEQNRYNQIFEYMFIFSKGKPKTFNPIRTRTKGYTPSNSSTQRNEDGSTTQLEYEQGKDFRNKANIWEYGTGFNKSTNDKIAFGHPAIFPENLARDHIKSWSNSQDIVLDPFMGSGTLAKMCIALNRKYIGFEINQDYIEIARKRAKSVQKSLMTT